MIIFLELQEYCKHLDQKNKEVASGKSESKDYCAHEILTEEEQLERQVNQGFILVHHKPTLWQNITESLRCLGQVFFVVVTVIIGIFVLSFLTRGCNTHVDTDHVHFERYK